MAAKVIRLPVKRNDRLSPEERKLWHMWRLASESVLANVSRDIAAGTGLSAADYGILSRLAYLGHGWMSEPDLAASMRLDAEALTQQLGTMEARDLTTRRPNSEANGVDIAITPAGELALAAARPFHGLAVRQHLLSKLTPAEAEVLLPLCERLIGFDEDDED